MGGVSLQAESPHAAKEVQKQKKARMALNPSLIADTLQVLGEDGVLLGQGKGSTGGDGKGLGVEEMAQMHGGSVLGQFAGMNPSLMAEVNLVGAQEEPHQKQ